MWYCETATDVGAEDVAYKVLSGGPRFRNEGYKTPEVIYNPQTLFAWPLSICCYQFTLLQFFVNKYYLMLFWIWGTCVKGFLFIVAKTGDLKWDKGAMKYLLVNAIQECWLLELLQVSIVDNVYWKDLTVLVAVWLILLVLHIFKVLEHLLL